MNKPALAAALVALALSSSLAQAKPAVKNLGGGLEELVGGAPAAKAQALRTPGRPELSPAVVFDATGRPLVRITLDGSVPAADVLKRLGATAGVKVSASDFRYRAGVIEAWVPRAALVSIAKTKGIRAVVPSSPMYRDAGAATTQGLRMHRINRLPAGIDGRGITIGVMSDSFDREGSITTAADDVASGDLPGPGNPKNSTPVTVLQEGDPGDTDEGRAMLQIVHDVAPRAKLGFATANGGEVNFANNIRSLAGLPGALRLDWGAVTSVGWIGLAYSTVFSLIAAYVLWNRGVGRLGASRTALFSLMTPLFATIIAMLVLHERPVVAHLVGGGMIVGGVLLSRRPVPT